MMNCRYLKSAATALAGLLFLAVPPAWAQQSTGHIYGTVTDATGAALPGATVALTAPTIGARDTQTDSLGQFRFLRLDLGSYKVTVSLPGFATVVREVIVQTGVNLNLTFGLKVATVEETVTVTAETPVVDVKRTGTSTNLTRDELEKVPQARDPWAILRSVPGVVVDRVNVAGNESGQQANFAAKGALEDDAMWSIDGLVVTDMASLSSPTYYDYDAFSEMQITTGGTDARTATGGVGINLVTKRGTNAFQGGGRYYLTHDDLQSANLPEELAADPRLRNADGTYRDKADHLKQISDYGADIGGPLVKDKVWFYGSYGVQDIRLIRLNGTSDKTVLKSYNAKVNWQPSPSDTVSAFWFWGRKIKEGRAAGLGGISQETDTFTRDQDDARKEGTPPGLYKLEWNHVFGPSLYLNAKAAYYGTGFALSPRGGLEQGGTLDYTTSTGLGSFALYQSLRPQTQLAADGNYFKTATGGNHELKFGFSYRSAPVDSVTRYSGRIQGEYVSSGDHLVRIYRDRVASFESKFLSAYLSDTFTRDRLTLNVGLRFDHQQSRNRPSEAEANQDFPQLLPALSFDGGGTGVTWKNVAPRVSATYALDEGHRTVARASYAHYAGQVGDTTNGDFDNPIGAVSYLTYGWADRNGDRLAQKDEVLVGGGLVYYYNIDPGNPTAVAASVNAIDPRFRARTDDEVVVGLDHQVAPNLAVGAAYTHKRTGDLNWDTRNGVDGPEDYTRSAELVANTALGQYTGTIYGVDPTQVEPGRTRTNRPDYGRVFNGLELTLTKRLANRWMARAAFSWNDWAERFDGGVAASKAVQDPTRTRDTDETFAGPLVDGGAVPIRATGSGRNQLYSAVRWQITASALIQLPWSLELAGSVLGRQGFLFPVYIQASLPGEASKPVLAQAQIDERHYPNLWNLDLRLAKNLKLGGTSAVLAVEAFNVLNANTDLRRVNDAGAAAFNRLDEILSPRVLRLGLRFNF